MKRILFALALCMAALSCAWGQTAALQGHSFLGGVSATTSGMNSTNRLEGIIPSATITVYLTGTMNLATIYSDATGTPLANPFTSNAVGGVNPGGYIFWAAINQGYDIVASGGIPPNTYSQPVTLCADCYPGSSFSGSPTVVEVNSTPISPASPANFVNTSSVTWQFTGGQIQATAAGGGSSCTPGSSGFLLLSTGTDGQCGNSDLQYTFNGIDASVLTTPLNGGNGLTIQIPQNGGVTVQGAGSGDSQGHWTFSDEINAASVSYVDEVTDISSYILGTNEERCLTVVPDNGTPVSGITLPDANGATSASPLVRGVSFCIFNNQDASLTITPAGSDTINGSNSAITLPAYGAIALENLNVILPGAHYAWAVIGTSYSTGSSITWPTSADLVISNATNSPAGLAPVNGDCVVGSGGAWTAGSCTGSSGVTSFSGDGILLNNSASTGAVTATLANTGVGYGVWGNISSSSGAASYNALSTYPTAAFPTLNQSTTGNAATATNLATYPTLCSSGQFSQGLSSGSNNCATPSGSGFPTGTTGGAAYYTGSSGAISSDVLIDQSSIPLQINAASLPTQMNFTYNSGHAPSGVSGSASIAPDSSGNLDDSENGGSFYRICNSNNYTTVCPGSGGLSLTSPNSTLNLSPSPITGTGTLDINLGNANTWTAIQSFTAGINTGSSSPTACSGAAGGCIALTEGGTAVTPASGVDTLRGDSVHHCIEMSLNDGSENCISSGSGTPGGSNTQVQYNNSSAFGGISGVTSNGTSLFTAGGALFHGSVNAQSGGSYTFAASDENSLLNYTGTTLALTLPQATTSGFGVGAVFNVVDNTSGSTAITITPTTSTINGNSSQELYKSAFGVIFSDGTNYEGFFAPGLSPNGQTLNELGTSSLPGISFVGETGAGFYYTTSTINTPDSLNVVGSTTAGSFNTNAGHYDYCMDNTAGIWYGGSSTIVGIGNCTNSYGTAEALQFVAETNGTGPTCAVGTAAGTGATCSLSGAANQAGVIALTTGTSTSGSGTLVTITDNGTLAVAPHGCSLTAQNATTALQAEDEYTTAPSTTAWTIGSGATAFTASTTYTWSYVCM